MSQNPHRFAHAAFDRADIFTEKEEYLPLYHAFGSVALLLLRTNSMTETIRTAI